MLNKLTSAKVPLWIVIFVLAVISWAVVILLAHVNQRTPISYNVTLPISEKEEIDIDHGPLPAFQDRDYFNSVKERLAAEEHDFIKINLDAETITAYQEGEVEFDFPIAATGEVGTWTETPAGLYAIEFKTPSHFSSLYHVHMPYSLQFYGNYFIHGWPYHPGGRPVYSDTSAGCVRLETEHAEKLYQLAWVGMPVLVFEEGYERDDFSYFDSLDEVSGSHFIGIDLRSDYIFFEENLNEPVEVGELSKLLSGLVVSERLPLGTSVTIDRSAAQKDTLNPRFGGGEQATIFTLLSLLLNESSNEAAAVIANRMGSGDLSDLIDQQIASLGMEDTEIENVVGSRDNISSAQDMVALAKYLYFNRSSLLKLSRGNFEGVYLDIPYADVEPFHGLHSDPDFVGGFVTTEAEVEEGASGSALAIFELEIRGETRPIGIFVANSSSPVEDIREMMAAIKLMPRSE